MLRSLTQIHSKSTGFKSTGKIPEISKISREISPKFTLSTSLNRNLATDAINSSSQSIRSNEPLVNAQREFLDIVKRRWKGGHNFEKDLNRRDFVKFQRVKSALGILLLANPITNPILSALRSSFPSIFPDSLLTPQLLEARKSSLATVRRQKVEEVKEWIKKELESKGKSDIAQYIIPATNGQASFLDNVPKDKVHHVENLFVNDVNGMDEAALNVLAEGLGIRMANNVPLFYLRYRLGEKLEYLDMDDRRIKEAGLNSLTEEELKEALAERGYLSTAGMTREQLEEALRKWSGFASNRSPDALVLYSLVFRN